MTLIAAFVAWLSLASVVLALLYRESMLAAWEEPVLRCPILILESDDWGYGPSTQAERLDRIADALAGVRDGAGRNPVVTLGVILAGPDTQRIRDGGGRLYHRLSLDDLRFAPIREAMLRGSARGVFALQLHGMEHFRPATLMRQAGDPAIRAWLTGDSPPPTEDLPPPLQSRWIDAGVLPSALLSESEVLEATAEEAAAFAAIFGTAPEVVVPTTFVWTAGVERGWSRAGLSVVVTPGRRNESRDAGGEIVPGRTQCFNGQTAAGALTYVVRDAYFEPALGHTAERALAALRARALCGRPALLEMHRFNFLEPDTADKTLAELRALLRSAIAALPTLRFMSTAELAQQYRERSSLLERRTGARVHFFIRRMAEVSRLRKLAWATGAALPAWLTYVLTRPGPEPSPAR